MKTPHSALPTPHSVDPEHQLRRDQLEDDLLFRWFMIAFLVLGLVAGWLLDLPRRIRHWFAWQSICVYCTPRRRYAGNPWARHRTHGACRRCKQKWAADLQARARTLSNGCVSHSTGNPVPTVSGSTAVGNIL